MGCRGACALTESLNLSDASRASLQPRLYYTFFYVDNFGYYIIGKSLSFNMKEKPVKHSFRSDEYTAEILENLMEVSGKNKTNVMTDLIQNNAASFIDKEQKICQFHNDFEELKLITSSIQKSNSTLNQIMRFLNAACENATSEQYMKVFQLLKKEQHELIKIHNKAVSLMKRILNLRE